MALWRMREWRVEFVYQLFLIEVELIECHRSSKLPRPPSTMPQQKTFFVLLAGEETKKKKKKKLTSPMICLIFCFFILTYQQSIFNVNSTNDFKNQLNANTIYKISSTVDLDANTNIRGGLNGTVISCFNVDVCLRARGGGSTTTVTNVQVSYTNQPPQRTFLQATHGAKIEMTLLSMAPGSQNGFTLLAGLGDMCVKMTDVTVRGITLIAGNETIGQSIGIELTRINVTQANNAIVLGGGVQTASTFKMVDSELAGNVGHMSILRIGSAESNATYREFNVENCTFRNGIVDVRVHSTVKFTDTTHISSTVTASFRDAYILRSQIRSTPSFAWTVPRGAIVRFDQIDIDSARGLLTTSSVILDDLKVSNLVAGPSLSNWLVELTGNATLRQANSAIQNITMRTCLCARVNGASIVVRNFTLRDTQGPANGPVLQFGNFSGAVTVTDLTVENSSCNALIEFAGKTLPTANVSALTLTDSFLSRVVSVSNQTNGNLFLGRVSARSMRFRRFFSIEFVNCSLQLTFDSIDLFNASFSEHMYVLRTDERVKMNHLQWRNVSLSQNGIVSENNVLVDFQLFNLTAVDVMQSGVNSGFINLVTSVTQSYEIDVSKVSLENCVCGVAVVVLSTGSGAMRGAAIVDDVMARNVRINNNNNACMIRATGTTLNLNVTRVDVADCDALLSVSNVNSVQLLNATVLRGRQGGVAVSYAPTVILNDVELTDLGMPCAVPLSFSSIVNLTLSSVRATRLRCAGATSVLSTVSVNSRTLRLSGSTFIDCAVPVLYQGGSFDNVTIDKCRFEGNVNASANGALVTFSNGGPCSMTDSVFLDNVGGETGVFYMPGGDLLFSRSQFFNNTGNARGVVYATGANNVTIDQCVFRDNVALNSTVGAGAVALYGPRTVSVTNSDFVGNRATVLSDSARAVAASLMIFQNAVKATLINVTMRENVLALGARLGGDTLGAVYFHFLNDLTLRDACICDNWMSFNQMARERFDLGCIGTAPNGNFSIQTQLAKNINAVPCQMFQMATCSNQMCPLRAGERFQMVSRSTVATTTTTTTTTTTMTTPTTNSTSNATTISFMTTLLLDNSPSSSVGMIVGIVLGSLAFLAIIGIVVGVVMMKRRKSNETTTMTTTTTKTVSPSTSSRATEFVSARDEYGSFETIVEPEPHYNSTFRMLD
jgi:hypothetical protein